MTILDTPRAAGLAALLAMPAAAQETDALTIADEVRAEIGQAMEAIAAYSEQELDQALTQAREALNRLDAETLYPSRRSILLPRPSASGLLTSAARWRQVF